MIDSYTMECNMGLHESKTNADRIRSMTDEELADLMDNSVDYFDCDNCEFRNDDVMCGTNKGCQTHILRWLKMEV